MREVAGVKIERATDVVKRQDGVTDRQGGRGMGETEWGLQLQYVRVSLQDEEAKKPTNFHSADTPELIPCTGHYSQPCV